MTGVRATARGIRHASAEPRDPPPLARRDSRDAGARLAAHPHQHRPGADPCHRRRPARLGGAVGAGGRNARSERLFRLPDLRHRPRHRDRPDDREGAGRTPPQRSRRPPDGAAGYVGGGRADFAGLGDPVVQRLDPRRHRPGSRPRGGCRALRARSAMGLPPLPLVSGAPLFISALEKPLWSFSSEWSRCVHGIVTYG